MFLSGPASHAAFASVATGMARRQACAIKRQTMTCRWWRLVAFIVDEAGSTSVALPSSRWQVDRHSFVGQLINLGLQLVSPVD